jgi:hypothetical protein
MMRDAPGTEYRDIHLQAVSFGLGALAIESAHHSSLNRRVVIPF